jgi:hypothetical protein
MRKTVIVAAFAVLAFGLCAGIAGAQVPTSGNVYFGYTYYNTNLAPNRGGLNGWQGTLEGKLFPLVGIVADLTGQYGSLDLAEVCPVVPVGGRRGLYDFQPEPARVQRDVRTPGWDDDREVSSVRRI